MATRGPNLPYVTGWKRYQLPWTELRDGKGLNVTDDRLPMNIYVNDDVFFNAPNVNNYALRVFSVQEFIDTDATGIVSTTLGTGYSIVSTAAGIGSTGDQPTHVVGLGTAGDTTTAKLLIQTDELDGKLTGVQRSQLNELVVMQHGSEVYMIDYAQMINDDTDETNSPSVGLGTFGADVRSGIASVYFTPLVYTMSIIGIIYASLTTLRQIDLKKIIALGLGGQLNREDNVTEKLD